MTPDPELAGKLAGKVLRDQLASLREAAKVAVGDVMFGVRYAADGSVEHAVFKQGDDVPGWVEAAPHRAPLLVRRTEEVVAVRSMTYPDGTNKMIAGEITVIVPDVESGDTWIHYQLGYAYSCDDVSTSLPELAGRGSKVVRGRFATSIEDTLRSAGFIDYGALGNLDENEEN